MFGERQRPGRAPLAIAWRIGLLFLVPVAGAIGAIVLFYPMLEQTRNVTLFVDIAARQRLIAEQLVHRTHIYLEERHVADRDEIRGLVSETENNLALLVHGGKFGVQRLPPAPPQLAQSLANLDATWRGYRESIQTVLDTHAAPAVRYSAQVYIWRHVSAVVEAADGVIRDYEAWHRQRFERMLALFAVLVCLNLLALVLAIVYLVRYNRERLRAEADLSREHGFLDAILGTLGAIVLVTDRDGRILIFNKACERITGYTAAEVAGRPFWDFLLLPEERAAVEAEFRNLTSGMFPNTYRNYWLTRSGEKRLIDWSNACLTNAGGVVETVIGTGVDVTERVEAEQALRQSRELYQGMLSAMAEGVIVLNGDGRVVTANTRAAQILGFTVDQLLGRTSADPQWQTIHEDGSRFAVDELLAIVTLRAGVAQSNVVMGVARPEGEQVWISVNTEPLPGVDGGRPGGVVATFRDVTAVRATERALRDSEALFRELAENIREVFFVRDTSQNRIIYISPAFEALWGMTREQLYTDRDAFMKPVHADDRARVLAALRSQDAGGPLFNAEYRLLLPSGETRWMWARTFPIRDARGTVYRVAGLVEDITERKRTEDERLAHDQRQRDALVREVHHRIKNNLQGVVGLLRQHATASPELSTALENAILQVNTMAVVHGLQGRGDGQILRLCDMARNIAQAVIGLTGTRVEPVVERRAAEPVRLVEAEAVPVALILNELIFNAVKHRDPASAVPVRVYIDCDLRTAQVRVVNPIAAWPPGFDFAAGRGLGTGLSLVRALLPPRSAGLTYSLANGLIIATLQLLPPLVDLPADA